MTEAKKLWQTQRIEFKKFAKELLEVLPGETTGKLLDIGCGLGWVVEEANKRGLEAVGIDAKRDFVEVGKKHLHVDLRWTSWEKFQTREKYDVVVLKHVLEHVEKADELLQKIKSWLKPNGILLISCPNFMSLMSLIFRDRWYGLCPMEHRWQFSPKSLTKLLVKNGYIIEKVIINDLYYDVPGWKGIIFSILLIIARLFNAGDQVIVLAKKR